MAKIGWAHDMKTVSPALIAKRAARTGDGSHKLAEREDQIWGWGDNDMREEDKKCCVILHRKQD